MATVESSESLPFTLSIVVAILLLFRATAKLRPLISRLPYPPGPRSKDVISGNARQLLESRLWFTMTDWAATYGPVMHLRSFNTHMIILNSVEDAVELLEKRSNNNSDRPYIPMISLIGWDYATGLKPYGQDWKAHRRLLQQTFKPATSLKYRPVQVEKVNDMLYRFIQTPDDFLHHIKILSASIIMSVAYGYEVFPKDDYFQEITEAAVHALSIVSYPGAAVVNLFPALRFLPSWFPGAGFHRVAQEAVDVVTRSLDVPYQYVRDKTASGTVPPSIVATQMESCKTENDHRLLKEAAASAHTAGSDTTSSSLATFIYAMVLFPEVQKKAQDEIDRVIGNDRLISYADEAGLPYLQALCREVFRWRPVLPLGNFHSSIAEDVYQDYYIPKGTTIVANVWAMTRSYAKYKNPEEFNPDRFFDDDNKLNADDVGYTFGFGRRICPGRHLASATAWLAIGRIISAFDIRPLKDASGNDIPLSVEYTGGLISHPLPFQCSITPRSDKVKQLIIDANIINGV